MLKTVALSVGITEVPESWERYYDEAMADMPERIPFLQEDHFERLRQHVLLSDQHVAWIQAAMKTIREHESLRTLAWLWHTICYRKVDTAGLSTWPIPNVPGSEPAQRFEGFPAVLLLSGYDRVMAMYRERNVPEQIIKDTLTCVHTSLTLYEVRFGYLALGMHYMNWTQHHFNARLYMIGRLEFEMRNFSSPIRVYRHVNDGKVVALSEQGVEFRGDGLVNGTNGRTDTENGWTATLTETDSDVTGCPLHPGGYAERNPVTLNKQDWVLALAPGHPVLSVHIPRKGAFTTEACRESFNDAVAFFAKHYPEFHYSAFMCVSWLLDPQLHLLLDESSNLLQFQNWYQLYPVKSDDVALYQFVFQCQPCETEKLPETTSLQRKIKQFMLSGERLHAAGGFAFPPFE
ncbi:MAG: hypothetical protein K0Q59_3201 [Paenibacillus sp.]|nr:hypothetical protein [Paenibacillus sp.]